MTEEQNNKVSLQLEAYTKRPLSKSADGVPLLLLNSDKNAATIVAEMNRLYPGQAFTLQRCLDLIQGEFGKQLEWRADPTYRKVEAPPPALPTPISTHKDTRTREQKLQDAGERVYTHKASAQDQADEKARHDAARDKLKALFSGDPKRAEFDRKLRDVNVYVEVLGNRIDRAKTNRVKEQMRVELRKQYPQFSELLKKPESERDTKW
jgi:hypothetical protein